MAPERKGLLASLVATPGRRLTLLFLALGVLVYVPFAGNYGMWDPWETHYGEVARQMLERNDYVSQWWPGSPQDRAEFWSKPVLTFWLMALSMKLFGLEWHPHAPADEIASTWRAEWASRLPFVFLGIVGVWATYELVRRILGKRPAMLTAVVLLTSSQWALIARQAMTDMAFVVPMTVALALGGLALLSPDAEVEAELPRIGTGRFSFPAAGAFYGFVALALLTILPQLIVISIQLKFSVHWRNLALRDVTGLVPMLPYWVVFYVGMYLCMRATTRRQLYLFSAYVLCGLASLAKGPAGLMIPALVMGVYLIVTGRLRDVWLKLEVPRGVLLFVATTFPWYHAMLIRHGVGFWNEFIGDNYVRRAGGRHGDRGTFEYYLQYIGYGMFPWSGFVALGSLTAFRQFMRNNARARLAAYAVVWALVDWALVTLVNTKFHHYILPALPPLAILAALCIDELIGGASLGSAERGGTATSPPAGPDRALTLGMWFIGVPLTFLCGRDLAAFPPRILWMFNYDYVNMPGTGRPWPLQSLYGDRYEYGNQIMVMAIVATLAAIALTLAARRRAVLPSPPLAAQPLVVAPLPDDGPYREPGEELAIPDVKAAPIAVAAAAPAAVPDPAAEDVAAFNPWLVLGGALVLLAVAIAFGPALPRGTAPTIPRWLWLAPTACMVPFAVLFVHRGLGSLAGPARGAVLGLSLCGVVWTGFLIDKLYIELSPHWAQKHVIAAYYANRKSAEEPLIAWQLYWRGENFYSKNEIYKSPQPDERTVFLGDRNVEKMQKWFAAHPGRRVFFVVERVRYESLRGLLPAGARSSLQIIDQSNNKLYLAAAQL